MTERWTVGGLDLTTPGQVVQTWDSDGVKWTSGCVRVLRDPEQAVTASRAARSEYAALFAARFDLTPPHEWCDRWWPATAEHPPL